MFPSQLNKSLRDVEREITTKECALSYTIDSNGKNLIVSRPTSKPSCKKSGRHVGKEGKSSSETSTKKCVSGKQSVVCKPHTTANTRAGVVVPMKIQDNGENIIHKEIIENTGATVEITVRTKPKEHARKRSRSRSRVSKGSQRNGVSSSKIVGDDAGSVSSEKTYHKYPNDPDINHRPWCELLKSRDSAFISYHKVSADAMQINSNSYIPCSGRPKSTDVGQNEFGEPSANLTKGQAAVHIQPNSESLGFNAIDGVKTIQKNCVPNSEISSQSKILLDPRYGDAKIYGSECDISQYPKEINTVFTIFDPLRILNFLVRELQGVVNKGSVDSGSVKRIVSDLEETLRRLPEKYKCVNCKQAATSLSPPTKPYESVQSAPFQDASDATSLREANLLLEERCNQLTMGKEKLEIELADKSKTVETLEKKEKECLMKIIKMTDDLAQMKKKNDDQMEMLTNLSKMSLQLKNENKVIAPLREAQSKLSSRLEDMTKNMEKLETELQVVKLERDRFRLLLHDKTKDVDGLKQLVKNIQFIVAEQLTNLKNLVQHKNAKDHLDNVIRAVSECSVNMTQKERPRGESEVPGNVLSPDKSIARPHCSSPSSSIVSSSPAISPSWQMISKISNIPDDDDTKAAPLVILAHGSDSNLGEFSCDDTVRFDDSKDFIPKDLRKFCQLQSAEELTPSMLAELQSVSGVTDAFPSHTQNKTVHVSFVQSDGVEPLVGENSKLSELCKVFQDLSKNVLYHPDPSQPFQKHVTDADNSSEWTDYSENA